MSGNVIDTTSGDWKDVWVDPRPPSLTGRANVNTVHLFDSVSSSSPQGEVKPDDEHARRLIREELLALLKLLPVDAQARAFVEACLLDPKDSLSRNAYADWLTDRGRHDDADRVRNG